MTHRKALTAGCEMRPIISVNHAGARECGSLVVFRGFAVGAATDARGLSSPVPVCGLRADYLADLLRKNGPGGILAQSPGAKPHQANRLGGSAGGNSIFIPQIRRCAALPTGVFPVSFPGTFSMRIQPQVDRMRMPAWQRPRRPGIISIRHGKAYRGRSRLFGFLSIGQCA